MSGRYAFSLPDPRERDGWFRIGNVDVTTTALIIGLGLISMVVYAIDPATCMKGAFATELVRDGEFWRVATWPVVNPPIDVWMLVGLAVFWFLGHPVEDQMGRKPFTWLVVAMTVIPAVVVTVLNVRNDVGDGRWSAYTFSVFLLSLGMITIFGLENPNARFFFGIPAWVISAAFVFIEVLRDTGDRAWAQLTLVLLVIVVGCVGARQRGMLDVVSFIPRVRWLAGDTSPYGQVRSTPPRGGGRLKRRRGPAPSSGSTVVSGPWGEGAPSGGLTPLEQAELDVLLDKISASGTDSLTRQEKDRLNALSRRMRGA